ncbi:MAG: hypothetical protein ABS63_08595 [Microbacterium sp. SCN 70-27]|uniref:LacI family DNA-binding transcriptional regulator n=1 Tax=unclassified Microbacterium TaxID=2609290 RepID=UPI00086C2454|nr:MULTISPECIES: LacI family DNA-binding transcriptional regulator [unclassified Microbacterium]MBN9225457.1 LacI family DNA-binding transcriptional regulator [Microbacterium sp.]ODT27376.1 MAG: hypothetical protein ABS63_08595 [Microbacterium sp. SCN 70-27]
MPQNSSSTAQKPRTRIVDVAREAGVSAQTVSNVLNGRPGFADATRERVLEAVERTGYIPDQAGRHLRTGQSRRVAFSMTAQDLDPRNPFSLTFLQAVMQTAAQLNRRVLVYTHEAGADDAFQADAIGRETDGFILANSPPGDHRVAILEDLGIPYSLMGRTLPDQSQAWVDIDNADAIGQAVEHVVGRGARRIAYADYHSDAHWSSERLRGTREALARHGLTLREDWIVKGDIAEIELRLTQVLSGQDRPDALITASDSIGILAVNIGHALGIHVGPELAITGFDGGVLATTVIPSLTTVEIPVAEIADRVLRRLIAQIDGTAFNPRQGEIVATRLVRGGSA